jgi:hypothetical protein
MWPSLIASSLVWPSLIVSLLVWASAASPMAASLTLMPPLRMSSSPA